MTFEVADVVDYEFARTDLAISCYCLQFVPPKFRQTGRTLQILPVALAGTPSRAARGARTNERAADGATIAPKLQA